MKHLRMFVTCPGWAKGEKNGDIETSELIEYVY